MKMLDDMLSVLACSVPVDILPGENDPSGHWLPQQPMPACVLPTASLFNTLNRACNPFEANVNGLNILGTSGQPINDLRRYAKHASVSKDSGDSMKDDELDNNEQEAKDLRSEGEVCVDWLEEMVQWRHMAPTAPDTLDTYPMLLNDPFVMETSPNVFFAGNQPNYAAKKVALGKEGEETLLISVPVFATTGIAVLVNLKTLECAPISFKGIQ
jgi:DNA polymerase delta subunit 2